uniref:Ig-like domain-containing protein n=1 Tax=Echeneis naucrates TaxID=173247 RepID=A0A665UXC2_ECHNA
LQQLLLVPSVKYSSKIEIILVKNNLQTTLTCTAPGLCSGSKPEITWMIENTDVLAQRHSSTLTFNPSAEHHGTTVTCKVRFTGNVATEETVTLNVTREWYKHYIIKTLAGRLSLTSEGFLNCVQILHQQLQSFRKLKHNAALCMCLKIIIVKRLIRFLPISDHVASLKCCPQM